MYKLKRSLQIDTQQLWEKYEDIAMHFNSLLMRLRTQSLAGIAAFSTIVGIFADKATANPTLNWLVATMLFFAMAVFWIAIFCIDYFYYSRLLAGAVHALKILEKRTNAGQTAHEINLSTLIEDAVVSGIQPGPPKGVRMFYAMVFAFILIAASFSVWMGYRQSKETPIISETVSVESPPPPTEQPPSSSACAASAASSASASALRPSSLDRCLSCPLQHLTTGKNSAPALASLFYSLPRLNAT